MKALLTILIVSIVGINVENIKIEHGNSATTLNRNSDEIIFRNRDRHDILYTNGKSKTLRNEYGENDFLITYKDILYIAFRQFKTNIRNNHLYKFKLAKEKEKYIVEVRINGEGGMSFKKEMRPILESYKYLGNQLRANYKQESDE